MCRYKDHSSDGRKKGLNQKCSCFFAWTYRRRVKIEDCCEKTKWCDVMVAKGKSSRDWFIFSIIFKMDSSRNRLKYWHLQLKIGWNISNRKIYFWILACRLDDEDGEFQFYFFHKRKWWIWIRLGIHKFKMNGKKNKKKTKNLRF